jgi:hypothetical protein
LQNKSIRGSLFWVNIKNKHSGLIIVALTGPSSRCTSPDATQTLEDFSGDELANLGIYIQKALLLESLTRGPIRDTVLKIGTHTRVFRDTSTMIIVRHVHK